MTLRIQIKRTIFFNIKHPKNYVKVRQTISVIGAKNQSKLNLPKTRLNTLMVTGTKYLFFLFAFAFGMFQVS